MGVESNRVICDIVSILPSSGVCVVGMYETVQPRNLGGPSCSFRGNYMQNKKSYNNGNWEVRCAHSTVEVG
jgi:hypothetical protein